MLFPPKLGSLDGNKGTVVFRGHRYGQKNHEREPVLHTAVIQKQLCFFFMQDNK